MLTMCTPKIRKHAVRILVQRVKNNIAHGDFKYIFSFIPQEFGLGFQSTIQF